MKAKTPTNTPTPASDSIRLSGECTGVGFDVEVVPPLPKDPVKAQEVLDQIIDEIKLAAEEEGMPGQFHGVDVVDDIEYRWSVTTDACTVNWTVEEN